ncbi:hypothetical protein LP420_09645 [Massilia sp. B-10]|nr:hypothetical protein LP420_09645 [Massilia sp. B-10]
MTDRLRRQWRHWTSTAARGRTLFPEPTLAAIMRRHHGRMSSATGANCA